MYQMRTTKPEAGNKFYNNKSNGGLNGAITGNPTDKGCNVLSNCVGYANGRYAEVMGGFKYQLVCNAERFYDKAKAWGLTITKVPTVGGIMVWEGKGNMAGHVAICERVDNSNSVLTSESAYNGTAFYNRTRTNSNGNWGMNSNYKYLGCIKNDAVKDEPTPTKTTYQGTFPKLPGRGYFKYWDKGQQVKYLQEFLNWAMNSRLSVDGILGNKTQAAVRDFQRAVGIKIDGLFGKNSLAKAKFYTK